MADPIYTVSMNTNDLSFTPTPIFPCLNLIKYLSYFNLLGDHRLHRLRPSEKYQTQFISTLFIRSVIGAMT